MDKDEYSKDDEQRKKRMYGDGEDEVFGGSGKTLKMPIKARKVNEEKLGMIREMKMDIHRMRNEQ